MNKFKQLGEILQTYGSAGTSLKQIPAPMKKIQWQSGTRNLDLGGGRYELATEYLRGLGVENLVFDTFNRSAEHNNRIAEDVIENGVDTVTCCNVLNVIDNADARSNVILQCAKVLRKGGTAYFSVYEGDKSGIGRQTKADSWQNNRTTADYVGEISQWFERVKCSNKIIYATMPKVTEVRSKWIMSPDGSDTTLYGITISPLFKVGDKLHFTKDEYYDTYGDSLKRESYKGKTLTITAIRTIKRIPHYVFSNNSKVSAIGFDADYKAGNENFGIEIVGEQMKKKYDLLKSKHPDCVLLFRTGDNYTAYFDDATKAADVLDVELDDENTVKFPHYDLDTNLPKLIKAGLRVAICDDISDINKRDQLNQLTEDDPNYFDAEELKRRLAEDDGETGEMLLDKARTMIHGTGVKGFSEALADRYNEGEKFDWTKAKKMAEPFGISSEQELMQACELAVVITARQIAHNGQSIAQRFAALKDLYEQQVSIRPLDTQSRILQQYSTPCPLAFLLGEFILPKDYNGEWGYFLEPSAGNGMLTVALPANRTVVNEIDNIRRDNLKMQGFYNVCNQDASVERPHKDVFIGIITNPPFGKLKDKDKIERNGWAINTLDYKMAVLALDSMDDNGKAAIIVGGKMWNSYWKPLNERSEKKVLFGQWKIFLGYLYAQYNVVDVIYINGDNIYRKQGTQYPIVAILINGRHEYNETNKPNYVFDPERDVIIDTYDQLFDRMIKHLQPTEADADELDASKIHFNPDDDSDITTDTQNIIDMAKPKYKAGDHLQIRPENGGHDFYVSEIHYYSSGGIPSYAGWDRLTRPALWYEADETMIQGLYDETPTPTDNDRRRRIAKAKAKALNLYIFAQKAQDKDKELIHNLLRGKIGGINGIDEYKNHRCRGTMP